MGSSVPSADEVVVVTGGASGIGEALARQFAGLGCRAVVVADLDGERAAAVAADLPGNGGYGVRLDVTSFDETAALVDRVEAETGPIGVWCSNAGVAAFR
nr:SDR family NAD(P)-dependent oxidoreductase [Micromonospora sp. DSM 115978]